MTTLTDGFLGRSRAAGEAGDASPTTTTMTDAAAGRWAVLALAGASTLAVVFRLRMLLVGRTLWLDETMLALNICGRSFAGLTRPLDLDQGAPIGFLFLEKLAITLLGPTDLAFRLVPFLASLATLALLHRFCSTNFGRWPAALAVALAGVSPALIYYSAELKQYELDVAVALAILVLASDAMRLGLSAGRLAGLAVAGAAAVWLSHPSVFVLAGAGMTLIVEEAMGRRHRSALAVAGVSAFWLANFAVGYALTLKNLNTNSFLADYWKAGFLDFPPRSAGDVRRYLGIGFGLFRTLFYNLQSEVDLTTKMEVVMAVGWAVGVATLAHRGDRRTLALLTAPIGFAFLAAALHKYPLRERLALFSAAATLPTIAVGIAGLMAARDKLGRVAGRALAICCLALPAMQAVQFLAERPKIQDARGVLGRFAREWRPGDLVILDHLTEPPFRFYRDYGGLRELDRVVPTLLPDASLIVPEELNRAVKSLKGRERAWIFLLTDLDDPRDGRQMLRNLLDQAGEPLASIDSLKYSAYLYRFP